MMRLGAAPLHAAADSVREPSLKERIIAMRAEGVGPRKIARSLDVTPSVVAGQLYRAGMTKRRGPTVWTEADQPKHAKRQRYTPEQRQKVRQMYLDGVLLHAIATEASVPYWAVMDWTRGLPRRRPERNAKDRAFKIAAMASVFAGRSQAKTADALGFSKYNFRNWIKKSADVAEARILADRAIASAQAAEAARAEQERAAKAAELASAIAHNETVALNPRQREIIMARIDGQTLRQIGDRHGVSHERIRQIEVVARRKGAIIPGAPPLSAAALTLYLPTGGPLGRPIKEEWDNPFLLAHAMLDKKERAPYRISDAERERRRQHCRNLAKARWGSPA